MGNVSEKPSHVTIEIKVNLKFATHVMKSVKSINILSAYLIIQACPKICFIIWHKTPAGTSAGA